MCYTNALTCLLTYCFGQTTAIILVLLATMQWSLLNRFCHRQWKFFKVLITRLSSLHETSLHFRHAQLRVHGAKCRHVDLYGGRFWATWDIVNLKAVDVKVKVNLNRELACSVQSGLLWQRSKVMAFNRLGPVLLWPRPRRCRTLSTLRKLDDGLSRLYCQLWWCSLVAGKPWKLNPHMATYERRLHWDIFWLFEHFE